MAEDKQRSGQEEDKEKVLAASGRKPYQKPAFAFEQVFETMALACGKAGSQHHCQIIKKRS
jgi:hypothetical protein